MSVEKITLSRANSMPIYRCSEKSTKMNTRNTLFKVRQERINKNYTQEYMAEELGMSRKNYANIENGVSKLTLERLHKIAVVLEQPAEYFVKE